MSLYVAYFIRLKFNESVCFLLDSIVVFHIGVSAEKCYIAVKKDHSFKAAGKSRN